MPRLSRRSLLRFTGIGSFTLLGGCLSETDRTEDPTPTPTPSSTPTAEPTPTPSPSPTPGIDPEDLAGYVRPEGNPETVPDELNCEEYDESERFGPAMDPADEAAFAWGYGTDEDMQSVFALRVNKLSFERGDEVTITLTNLIPDEQLIGTGVEFYVQVYTEAEWMDIRVLLDDVDGVVYPGAARIIPPSGEYEWSFELTEDRVFAGHLHEDSLVVCPGLPAGRYRFVYWALPDLSQSLMVAFDLVE